MGEISEREKYGKPYQSTGVTDTRTPSGRKEKAKDVK